MVILNVTYKCKPGKREEFLGAVKAEGIDAASRNESGNIRYDYFAAADHPDCLFLLEHWQDEDAFKAHTEEPHFKRLGEIKAEFVQETEIGKYTD